MQQKQKKNNNKPKRNNTTQRAGRKASNRNRRRQKRSNGGRGFETSAGIAVSSNLQQRVQFSGGPQGSLIVDATIPIYELCSNSFTTVPVLGSIFDSVGSVQYNNMTLSALGGGYLTLDEDEVFVDYISPVFLLIGSAFVRYHINRLTFIYEPQSTTTVSDRLVFGFAEDPNHPLLIADSGAPIPEGNILALSDSIAFAPWRSWSLDVSKTIRQDLLYTFGEIPSGQIDAARFSYFGTIACTSSSVPTVATPPLVYGVLYCNMQIEFKEFCPILNTVSLSARRLNNSISKKEKKLIKSQKNFSVSDEKKIKECCSASQQVGCPKEDVKDVVCKTTDCSTCVQCKNHA